MNRFFPCLLGALLLGLWTPPHSLGQASESHEVEHLEASELGPFEPEKRPNLEKVENQIVERTNQFRLEHDLEKVNVDPTLQKTAAGFAEYMANTDKYGHRADGRSAGERAKAEGYEFCLISENIAYSFKTAGFKTQALAERFVEGWKESPGHRKNMLQPHATETGVAIAQSDTTGVFYAVQLFGRPQSERISFRLVNQTETEFPYRIGDRQFTLPTRYARTHTLCQPTELRWKPNPPAAESAGDQEAEVRKVQPEEGDRFRVKLSGGKITLEKQTETPTKASSR